MESNEIAEDRKAGRLAGRILIAETKSERDAIWKEVPERLRQNVLETIEHYEKVEISQEAEKILMIPSRYERRRALFRVKPHLQERVKALVIKMFKLYGFNAKEMERKR